MEISGETGFHAVDHDVDVHIEFASAADVGVDADTRVVVHICDVNCWDCRAQ